MGGRGRGKSVSCQQASNWGRTNTNNTLRTNIFYVTGTFAKYKKVRFLETFIDIAIWNVFLLAYKINLVRFVFYIIERKRNIIYFYILGGYLSNSGARTNKGYRRRREDVQRNRIPDLWLI